MTFRKLTCCAVMLAALLAAGSCRIADDVSETPEPAPALPRGLLHFNLDDTLQIPQADLYEIPGAEGDREFVYIDAKSNLRVNIRVDEAALITSLSWSKVLENEKQMTAVRQEADLRFGAFRKSAETEGEETVLLHEDDRTRYTLRFRGLRITAETKNR